MDSRETSLDILIQWLREQRRNNPTSSLASVLAGRSYNSLHLVDLACIDLIERRRLGHPATVEDYILEFGELGQKDATLDLIDAELCVAAELNQPVEASSYVKRFPQLAQSIQDLLDLEDGQPLRFNPSPTGEPATPQSELAEIPNRVGGYRILRLLGRGAMGAVYEAKQVSLDRLVALKTIRGRLSENPASLARFAREAYAAAQLTHHNVVQIYDFGEDAGRYFFSMEWVRGGSLDALIREKGALDPKLAAGYTLQAARGLQYAHRNGMVHRDIKPANLLLSDEGVIKVADLGLVKVPHQGEADLDAPTSAISDMASGTQVTMQGTAVGTPAYMAPEQGMDAAAVDHRADIYSLGCSLYCMLSGHPPYHGSRVSEVMSQHANQPFPSLKDFGVGDRVPDSLQHVISRSTAKRPNDRYPSVSEMIDDLESYLGVSSGGSFSPTKQQADAWEAIATAYSQTAPWMRFASSLHTVWILFCVIVTCTTPMLSGKLWTIGPAMLFASVATSSLLAAHAGQGVLGSKLRRWLESMSWLDWVIGCVSVLIALAVIVLFGWWPGLLLGLVLGVIVGTVEFMGLQVPAREQRAESRRDAERFVRDLRIHGVDEQGMRRFIARYSGKQWQDLFEDLFGYDALNTTRAQLKSDPTFTRSTSQSVRDVVLAKLSAITRANVSLRDQNRLARIEQRSLTSEGLGEEEARQRAWQIAAALMESARSELPGNERIHGDTEAQAAHDKRIRIKAMLADARSGRYRKEPLRLSRWKLVFSSQARLLAGCLLLVLFVARGYQQGLFEGFTTLDASQMDFSQLESAIRNTASTVTKAEGIDGEVPVNRDTSTWSIGVAGLLLALSAIVSGWRMTPFAVVATIVILVGTLLGVPDVGPLPAWVIAAIVGVVIYIPGVLFGETTE